MPPTTAASGNTTSSRNLRYLRSPASRRRRGSAAIFFGAGAGGTPFCSAGNFSTGSAIALLLFLSFFVGALDGLANVFLDGFELSEQAVRVGRVDAFECRRRQFGPQPAQFAEQRARRLAQIEPVDAAVAIVAAALDPAVVAQPVDQPRQGNRLHLHLFREFRLLQALGAFHLGQHGPLRAGDAVARRLL